MLDADARTVETDAGDLAKIIHRYIEAFALPKLAAAVAARPSLYELWPLHVPWMVRPSSNVMAQINPMKHWPPEVAAQQVADRLRKLPGAGPLADLVKSGTWIDQKNGSFVASESGVEQKNGNFVSDDCALRWYPPAIAVVLHAEMQVQQDSERSGKAIRISTRKESRAVLRFMEGRDMDAHLADTGTNEAAVELVWRGKPRPTQLSFSVPGMDLSQSVVHAILDELKDDGVRDWLTLWAIAGEQGSSGFFSWIWSEHRERAGYVKRLKHHSDAEMARETMGRLIRLKNAELKESLGYQNGKAVWRRIGPHGLIDISAGASDNGVPVGARTKINPVLYKAATTKALRRGGAHFTLVSDNALRNLKGPDLAAAALLAFDHRYQASKSQGTIKRSLRVVADYAGLKVARRDRLYTQIPAMLDRICTETGQNWRRDGADDVIIEPAQFWVDAFVHGVPPAMGRSSGGIPRTGAALKAWRKGKRLSAQAVADVVGVNQSTVSRIEKQPKELPGDWVERLTEAEW